MDVEEFFNNSSSRDFEKIRRTFLGTLKEILSSAMLFASPSDAKLEGAHANIIPFSFTDKWVAITAAVKVFPVPGGPWMILIDDDSANFRAFLY
jgi:hypothetical protein